MLNLIAALALAGPLTVVSPTKWDVTATVGKPPPAQHIDIVLKNPNRQPMLWHLMALPPWANCWADHEYPELGQKFSGRIEGFKSVVVRIDLGGVPSAFAPGKYVWDVSFKVDGSTTSEVGVDCTLNLASAK